MSKSRAFALLLLFLLWAPLSAQEQASLIIKNGWVLPMSGSEDILKQGVVVIRGDRILAVGEADLLTRYQASKILDAEDGLVLPGMINTHGHLPMIAFRGLGEEGIDNRLFAYFFPLEKRMLSRDLIYKATRFGAVDMIQGGVTTFADMYYHCEDMARACEEVGIRSVLGQTVIGFPVVDAPEPHGGLNVARQFIENYQDHALVTPAVAPHAVFTVSADVMREVNKMSKALDAPVLIHAAEFTNESERIKENPEGLSPIAWLKVHGLLRPGVLLAHAIHLSPDDVRLVAESGVGVAHNPMANAKGATGIAPAWELKKLGARVGLGTDGPMSSNQTDLFRTLSYTSSMQRLRHKNRTIMTPKDVVEMATLGGAQALFMEDEIGTLEAGKRADIIIVETKSLNMRPLYDAYAALVFQASASNVQTVVVNGRIVMEKRKMATVSAEEVIRDFEPYQASIAEFARELAEKARQSKSEMKN